MNDYLYLKNVVEHLLDLGSSELQIEPISAVHFNRKADNQHDTELGGTQCPAHWSSTTADAWQQGGLNSDLPAEGGSPPCCTTTPVYYTQSHYPTLQVNFIWAQTPCFFLDLEMYF